MNIYYWQHTPVHSDSLAVLLPYLSLCVHAGVHPSVTFKCLTGNLLCNVKTLMSLFHICRPSDWPKFCTIICCHVTNTHICIQTDPSLVFVWVNSLSCEFIISTQAKNRSYYCLVQLFFFLQMLLCMCLYNLIPNQFQLLEWLDYVDILSSPL